MMSKVGVIEQQIAKKMGLAMNKKTVKGKALPEGWREVKLGDICENITTGKLDANKANFEGQYRFYTCAKKYYWIDTYAFDDEALLISGNGAHVGYIHYYNGKFNAYQRTYVLTGFSEDIQYLKHFMEQNLKNRIRTEVNAGNMPYIKMGTLANMPIKLPFDSEKQKAIASLLEKWDTAIEKTEALIAAKEQQFKWLLKTLISDQQDNPEWQKVKLGDVCKISKGTQLNKLHMIKTGKYPVLNGGMTLSGYTDVWNTSANTITISEGGNSCGYVNFNTRDFWAGGHCYTLTNLRNELYLRFLYHQLKGREQLIMRLRVGSGLPNIQKGDIKNFPFSLPPKHQQKEIARTLNTARSEIDLLKQLAEQYRTQKRGLMQKLLTGKWRVK